MRPGKVVQREDNWKRSRFFIHKNKFVNWTWILYASNSNNFNTLYIFSNILLFEILKCSLLCASGHWKVISLSAFSAQICFVKQNKSCWVKSSAYLFPIIYCQRNAKDTESRVNALSVYLPLKGMFDILRSLEIYIYRESKTVDLINFVLKKLQVFLLLENMNKM